jgi:hypothetical protein
MSALWAAGAACVLIAAFCIRVLIAKRSGIGATPDWLGLALFVAMLGIAVVVLSGRGQGAP